MAILREEMFALMYTLPGLALSFESLDAGDRQWLLERVAKQKRDEVAQIKKKGEGK